MHDAFLSYSRSDTRNAERLRSRLVAAGIETFTDRTSLTPGRPWQPELQRALEDCRAVIVLIGRNGFGDWQQREVQFALALQSHDDSRLVIPVLLDGAESPSRFLELNTWIDLGDPATEDQELARLIAALRPGGAEPAAATPRPAICPYRALKAFREEDARFFFGRDEAVDELEQKIEHNPIVAVAGASGSGKSSVVRAGLASRLRRAQGEHSWQIVTLTPTDRPLRALAAALVPLLDHGTGGHGTGGDIAEVAAVETLAESLRTDDGALRDLLQRALKNDPGTTRLLLIADQWEELYTLCEDQELRDRFVAQLLDAAREDAFRCVLTVRGDFWGKVLESAPLTEQLRDAQVNLAPMGTDGLRQAIVEPAKAVGLGFEHGLVERILADVGDEPGNLPLLEFLLFQLWELDHDDGTLSHEPYEQLGGVQGAIAHRAKEILASKGDSDRDRLRRVFGRLVRPGAGTADTRRRAAADEFGSGDAKLIGELVDARLLVKSTDEAGGDGEGDGQVTLEVAHEALIRGWPELRRWVDEDREFLSWLQRLHAAQAEHQRTQADSDLLTGHRLAEARRWLGERGSDLAPDEKSFVEKSAARARRARTWRVASVAAVMVVLAGALGVSLWFYLDSIASQERYMEHLRRTDSLLVERLIDNLRKVWPPASKEQAKEWVDDWLAEETDVSERWEAHKAFAAERGSTPTVVALKSMLDKQEDLNSARNEVLQRKKELAKWELWDTWDIPPQEGLLPLRMNEQGKYEFWFPASGTLPTWKPSEVDPERVVPENRDMAIVFVLLEGGTFGFREYDAPKEVTVERFFLSKYELTNAQWFRLRGRPSGFAELTDGNRLLPVAAVDWNECSQWAKEAGLALPTEEQWEYGCRAGASTIYYFGDDTNRLAAYAWFDENSQGRSHQIGSLLPNDWGLHDVHGNLWEWCQNLYREGDGDRVLRGGSWFHAAKSCRSVSRNGYHPGDRSVDVGFRPARSLLP